LVVAVGLGVGGGVVTEAVVGGVDVGTSAGVSLVDTAGVSVPVELVAPTCVGVAPTFWSGVQAVVATTIAMAPARARARRTPTAVRNGELAACIVTPCLKRDGAVRRCTALRVTRRPGQWLSGRGC
jgi:hypothetical protein